jgi:hypothetical protein
MPRATRWLLLVPLFLCLAGLYAVASPRAMAGYANPKFVYEHTNAEDMSCDRNRAGADAQRVLFWQILGTGEDARRAEKPLTWREVIHLWRASEDFRDVFFESLNEEWCYGLRDYLWECAPVSSKTLDNKYEHVVKDRGYACGFGARDGPEVFREHFRTARAKGEDVAVFPNLGGDAVLVAPVQNAGGLETDAGACVRDFRQACAEAVAARRAPCVGRRGSRENIRRASVGQHERRGRRVAARSARFHAQVLLLPAVHEAAPERVRRRREAREGLGLGGLRVRVTMTGASRGRALDA